MKENVNEDLLIRYIVGEASDKEKARVEEWISESEAHEKKYRSLRLIWDTSEKLASRTVVDENLAWQRFTARLEEKEAPSAKPLGAGTRISWYKIAATIALICTGGWILFFTYSQSSFSQVFVETQHHILVDTLSDGSIITLNKNSKIQYPKRFAKGRRAVKLLQGEAFFDVAPDPSKPFQVSVNDLDVKVVGTSFNIKKREDHTELIVESGIVEVSKKQVVVRLKRNEMLSLEGSSDQLNKTTVPDQLYMHYRTKEFVADGTPLYRIVDVLNEVYGVHIVIQDKEIENFELNTTFNSSSINSILNIICETFDIKMKKNGDTIILYK